MTELYLAPTGAKDLLADEWCGGRVPQLCPPNGFGWLPPALGHTGTVLPLIRGGKVLSLAWFRACSATYPSTIAWSTPTVHPTVEDAQQLAVDGVAMGLWQIAVAEP